MKATEATEAPHAPSTLYTTEAATSLKQAKADADVADPSPEDAAKLIEAAAQPLDP